MVLSEGFNAAQSEFIVQETTTLAAVVAVGVLILVMAHESYLVRSVPYWIRRGVAVVYFSAYPEGRQSFWFPVRVPPAPLLSVFFLYAV
jgi:hypothetical protein